jgi:DNA-binding CsgD family transcriptional regulator
MTKLATCPYCHQPIRGVRLGIYMSPRRAEIFDIIKAAGEGGVSTAVLAERLALSRYTVRSHIEQINGLLAETDWRISNFPGGGSRDNAYEVVRRGSED